MGVEDRREQIGDEHREVMITISHLDLLVLIRNLSFTHSEMENDARVMGRRMIEDLHFNRVIFVFLLRTD